jgi:TfoX/Sxy family transcriptional regulator of competence genes
MHVSYLFRSFCAGYPICAMAYSEKLAERIRERFSGLRRVVEKEMMGGLTFMYNGKMCVGILKDELMVRIDPARHEEAIAKEGCRTMDFTKRPMKGFVLVDASGMKTTRQLDYWMEQALEFNKKAKASKKSQKRD